MVRGGYGSGLAVCVTKVVLNESAGEGGVVLALVFRRLRSELPEYAYVMEQGSKNEALFLGHVIFAISPEMRSGNCQVSSGRGWMSICSTAASPSLLFCGTVRALSSGGCPNRLTFGYAPRYLPLPLPRCYNE